MSAGRPSGAGAGGLVRRWVARLCPPGRDAAEAVFLQQAGSAAPIAWLSWLPRAALLGLAILAVLWALPSAWIVGEGVDRLLGAEPGAAAWILLVFGLTVADVVRSARARRRLASAYAAADARLGGTFLRFPASLASAAALLVAARLPGLDALAGLAAALATQALSELAIRCLVSPRRLHMAGQVIWRGVRSPAALGLAMALGAVWVVPAPEVPPPTAEQVALRLMADPAVAAADAAVRDAIVAAQQDGSAPHELLRLRAGWDATHQSDGTVPASLRSSAAMLERVRAFQAFWAAERARSHSATDVSGRCATWPPSPPCAVQGAASPVPNSGGTLLYRIVRRGEAHGDGMFPSEMLDVFQAAGPDSWTPILRVAYDPGRASRVPRQVASPAGPMLILPPASPWSIQLGEVEGGTQVFLRQGTSWRRIDVASWLQQAAQLLPPHQCLLQTTYGLGNVPLATDIEPDFRTLSVLGQYGPQASNLDRAAGRAEFRFDIDDQTLVVRNVTLTSYPERRPWWRRWLQRGPEC